MPAQTIDDVISRLETIVNKALQTGDPLGIFAQVYLRTTVRVKNGIVAGSFEDPARMERFDVRFASRYLDAFDAYRQKQPLTSSWKIAFDAAVQNDLLLLQHLFMGMNAHINLDLGIALAESMENNELSAVEKDFFAINKILFDQIEEMQEAIGRLSPLLFLLDWIGEKRDERFAEFSLNKARSHAWSVANRLARLNGENRQNEIEELDSYVSVLNKLITQPGSFASAIFRVVKWFETKDVKRVIAALQ